METTDLKRCIGTTKAGDKSVRLSEPHMEPRENFSKKSSTKDGLRIQCKDCVKLYNDSLKLRPKVVPPEEMTCRKCGETKHHSEMSNNPNSLNGKDKICFECDSSNSSQWDKGNPDKKRARNQRRNDRLRSQPNEDVSKEVLLEIHGNLCYLCGKPVPEDIGQWHMEHVIPSSRGDIGTTYENCRVAHAKCNHSKGAKTYWEVVVGTESGWKNCTIDNIYLFNENYAWHMETFWADIRKNQPHLLKGTDELTVT